MNLLNFRSVSSSDENLSASESSCSDFDILSMDSNRISPSPSSYIADLAPRFERLSLSSIPSPVLLEAVLPSPKQDVLQGIVYKLDRDKCKAMIRVMIDQDSCHAKLLPSKTYRNMDINHFYIAYKQIKDGVNDIEIGSVIEILEYEGKKIQGGLSEAHKFIDRPATRISKYSVNASANNRLANQLVAITRAQNNCLRVVGSDFGASESIVALPRKSKAAEWKSIEPHSFIYGDLIHLPKFYKIILNKDGVPELIFDHEARLVAIQQYENAVKNGADPNKTTGFISGRPFLTRIRKLTKMERKTILNQTRNLENAVTLEQATQFVRDPLLTCAALEEYVARESVKQFSSDVTDIVFEVDKKFSPHKDVIYVPITNRVKECLTVRGRDTWHLGSDLVLSCKAFLGKTNIPVIIDRTSVDRKVGKCIRLVGGAGSEHVLDAIKKHKGNINWSKLNFKLGPMDEDSNSNAAAIKAGFDDFFTKRSDIYEAFVGRASAPNMNNIPKINEDYSIAGQKLDTSQRLAMRTALGVPGFTCVSAPPGSGKTFMISGIVAAKLKEQPMARFAITATTNIAVTNAVETVHSKFPKEKKVRQFSRKAEAELGKNSAVLDISLKRLTRNKVIVEDLMSRKEFAKAVVRRDAAEAALKTQAPNIAKQLEYVANFRRAETVVGVTFIKFYAPKVFGTTGSIMARSNHEDITHLIVDEAAQMSQIDALSLYCRLPDLKYITLVGDSRQLGPFTDLQKDTLAHQIMNVGELTRLEQLKSSAKRELQFIYRCHPKIIDLLLKPIYGQQLQSGTPEEQRTLALDKIMPRAADGSPVLFVQVDGREKDGRNQKEAKVVIDFLYKLRAKGIKPEEVSIICHHRAQKDSLCQALKDKGTIGRLNLMYGVNTVDSYQGKEAKVVLILTTKTCESPKPEVAKRIFSFISDPNRETVAVSRAQHAIYLFGNWSQVAVMPFWNQFGEGLIKSGAFVNEKWKPISDPGFKTKPQRTILGSIDNNPVKFRTPKKDKKMKKKSELKPTPKVLGNIVNSPLAPKKNEKSKNKPKKAEKRKARYARLRKQQKVISIV